MSVSHGLSGSLRLTSHYKENSGLMIVAVGAVAAAAFVVLGFVSALFC
ncbi:hypothetical protein KDL45_09605 [bacterium]|nr:hypothetical protein [bacterium]